MKNNYSNNGLKNGLKALAVLCVLGCTSVNAQTLVNKTGNIRTVTTTTYAAGPVTITSGTINAEGTTFQLQATLTPYSTANGALAVITSNGSNRYGVDGSTIDGNLGESIAISNLTVVNFSAGTTAYTAAAVQDIYFNGVTLINGNGTSDQVQFTIVGGTNAGINNIGATATTSVTINFGEDFLNAAAATKNVGSATGVTAFTLGNGSTVAADSWQIVGTNWTLNFRKDDTLGVNDFEIAANNGLIVSPNPVVDTVALNMTVKSAEIIDMTGRTVKSFNGETESLDVSGLVSGTYILKVMNQDGKVYTKKIIK